MMNPLIELLRQSEGTVFVNEDGNSDRFRLLPPWSDQELGSLALQLPCQIPTEIHELLRFAGGFSGTWLEEIRFAEHLNNFGLDSVFSNAIALANDGAGNFWAVDLTADSREWGPIFYISHDAPVVVFQTNSLLHFVREVIRGGNPPWESEINQVSGTLSDLMWAENPGVLSFSFCVNSTDPDLSAFAKGFDETWQFIDLRNPVLGDGFSWGRYGPKTIVKRCGEKRIFAYQKNPFRRRLLDSIR